MRKNALQPDQTPSAKVTKYQQVIQNASNKLDRILDVAFGVAQYPLMIASVIAVLLSAFFVYWIN